MPRLRAMVMSQASTEPRDGELRRPPPRVDEGLLEDLLGVGGLAEHAEQQRVQSRRVAPVQLLEGTRVPAPDRLQYGPSSAGRSWRGDRSGEDDVGRHVGAALPLDRDGEGGGPTSRQQLGANVGKDLLRPAPGAGGRRRAASHHG